MTRLLAVARTERTDIVRASRQELAASAAGRYHDAIEQLGWHFGSAHVMDRQVGFLDMGNAQVRRDLDLESVIFPTGATSPYPSLRLDLTALEGAQELPPHDSTSLPAWQLLYWREASIRECHLLSVEITASEGTLGTRWADYVLNGLPTERVGGGDGFAAAGTAVIRTEHEVIHLSPLGATGEADRGLRTRAAESERIMRALGVRG